MKAASRAYHRINTMPDRYFVEQPLRDDHAVLTGGEAHHLAHVLRARPGREVILFDNSGDEFLARVERIDRGEISLALIQRRRIDREATRGLTLAVALPKGDRQRWLVEKSVELGVAALVPLTTQRSVSRPTPSALARLRRGIVEASKQCGRNRLMQILDPLDFPALVASTDPSIPRYLAQPADRTVGLEPFNVQLQIPPPRLVAAIGPEGGFTDQEVQAAVAAGWQLIDLGPRILRVETAAMLIAALCLSSLSATASMAVAATQSQDNT